MRSRKRFLLASAVAAIAVGLAVHFFSAGVERYRGASGVATALVIVAALDLFAEGVPGARVLAAAVLVLLVAKTAVEVIIGRAVLPGTLPGGIRLAPRTHLAGAVAGALIWLGSRPKR